MIDYIWVFMIIISFVFSIAEGNIDKLTQSMFDGATNAVTLTISLIGSMAFWMGITKIAGSCGITAFLQKIFMPLINFLFPAFKGNNNVKEKISLNFTANLIGLSNAATPLGLSAMCDMEKNHNGDYPSKEMIMFVVVNTASLQILPTGIASIRHAYGSLEPFSVLIPVWITSFGVLFTVVTICKAMEKLYNDKLR